jgi:hypothetical protein
MKAIQWLMESDAYVQYATRLHILKQDKRELKQLKSDVLADPRIQKHLSDIADFHGLSITNHKNAELPIHKLIFLMETGLDAEVEQIDMALGKILSMKGEDGIYKSLTNIPTHFGGTGKDAFSWCLCDAPLLLYALLRGGLSYEEHVQAGADYIAGLIRDNGFPCAASRELGKFRGPGKQEDCCPYATLQVLKLFSLIPAYKNAEIARIAGMALLDLWENSWEKHPFLFKMGTDFRKLKVPTIWYDIVSVTDCLSHYDWAIEDERYKQMIGIIANKANAEMQFTPESIYLKFKEWDFGQKKQPSPWLTYVCLRILHQSHYIDCVL